jgi:protocatechuate 3,4-dioxygenase alpha subunit
MATSPLTPSQTVGPFFEGCLLRDDRACGQTLVAPGTAGTRIEIRGRVFDGEGAVVPDAVIEIWQANAAGRYNHPDDRRAVPLDPAFTGFGRPRISAWRCSREDC